MKLTPKQSMLLAAIEEGPLSTFALFDCLWTVYEDASVDPDYDCGYRDWTRSGIYASMSRLEKRGLVRRLKPERARYRKKGSGHGLASAPESPIGLVQSRSLPPKYEWALTKAGLAASERS